MISMGMITIAVMPNVIAMIAVMGIGKLHMITMIAMDSKQHMLRCFRQVHSPAHAKADVVVLRLRREVNIRVSCESKAHRRPASRLLFPQHFTQGYPQKLGLRCRLLLHG